MGFMKLLGTSHAFGRILDRPSRYRLIQQSLLPKFGGEKGPESAVGVKPNGLPPTSSAQNAGTTRAASAAVKVGWLSRVFRRRTNKTMNTVEADPSMASASAPPKPEHAFPFGRWTLFGNPNNRVPAAAPKSRPAAGPVQGELLLDAVKPVRNDLNDSDLEVVPSALQKVPEPASCLAASIEGSLDPALPAWRRVAAQFSTAEKS